MTAIGSNKFKAPSRLKLGACLIYEALVFLALAFVFAWLFITFIGDATHGIKRFALQLFIWLTVGAYFVWCWTKKGQTLAMQTWQFKLVKPSVALPETQLLSLKLAMFRYVLESLSVMLLGVGFIWMLIDRDHLFLHDRLLNTRIIFVPRNIA